MQNNKLLAVCLFVISLAGCAASPEVATSPAADATAVSGAFKDSGASDVAVAADAAAQAKAAKLAAAESPDDVICKRERVTGSHFPQKICRTRAQIEAKREADQKALQRNNSTGFEANSAGAN